MVLNGRPAIDFAFRESANNKLHRQIMRLLLYIALGQIFQLVCYAAEWSKGVREPNVIRYLTSIDDTKMRLSHAKDAIFIFYVDVN